MAADLNLAAEMEAEEAEALPWSCVCVWVDQGGMDCGILRLWAPGNSEPTFLLWSAGLLNFIIMVCVLGCAWVCVEVSW